MHGAMNVKFGTFSSHKSDRRNNDAIMTAVSVQEQYFIVWLDFERKICSCYVHVGLKTAVVYFNCTAFDVRYEQSSVFEWRKSLTSELWYPTDYIVENKSLLYETCSRKNRPVYGTVDRTRTTLFWCHLSKWYAKVDERFINREVQWPTWRQSHCHF